MITWPMKKPFNGLKPRERKHVRYTFYKYKKFKLLEHECCWFHLFLQLLIILGQVSWGWGSPGFPLAFWALVLCLLASPSCPGLPLDEKNHIHPVPWCNVLFSSSFCTTSCAWICIYSSFCSHTCPYWQISHTCSKALDAETDKNPSGWFLLVHTNKYPVYSRGMSLPSWSPPCRVVS